MPTADSSFGKTSTNDADKPVGKGKYRVAKGDCIEVIAYEHGHFWETIWEHPDNAELREIRGNPNMLRARDRVTIPPLRDKQVAAASENTHTFKMKGVPFKLAIQLKNGGEPRADEEYILEIEGKEIQGKTDADGWVRQPINPRAKEAKLILSGGEDVYEIALGHLDPIDTKSGQKQRLHNIGLLDEDDVTDDELVEAIRQFQIDNGLEVTGEADKQTQSTLEEVHSS